MNTHRYTPKLIVEDKANLCFNIPLYQRLFAWGEGQVKGLMFDLRECCRVLGMGTFMI